jgi:2-polyprenyl-6-methoxyphenol hydroxylase-like FAD-dependent oxidoreductase
VLDQILVDAAVAAGVELREGFSVQALIGDGDRITGIRGRTKAGSNVAEKGRLVVGADGRHSLVARSVQASESNAKPPLQGTSFTYWGGVPMEGFEFYPRGYRAVYAWLTNENLALIGVNWTGKDFSAVRADIKPKGAPWDVAENTLLHAYAAGQLGYTELQMQLPHRTWDAIEHQARVLGLRLQQKPVDYRLTPDVREIVSEEDSSPTAGVWPRAHGI